MQNRLSEFIQTAVALFVGGSVGVLIAKIAKGVQ